MHQSSALLLGVTVLSLEPVGMACFLDGPRVAFFKQDLFDCDGHVCLGYSLTSSTTRAIFGEVLKVALCVGENETGLRGKADPGHIKQRIR